MAQRFIAFFLLLMHINGAMLLPQVDETDVYYNGHQADDINSFIEYIEQEVLDIPDDTPEDEDNDNNDGFRLLQLGSEMCEQKIPLVQIDIPGTENTKQFSTHTSEKVFVISFDILTPPPKV
jgi:hypothetical protein